MGNDYKRIGVQFAKKVNKVIPIQYENTFTSSDTSLNRKQTIQVPEVPSIESFLEEDLDEFVSSFVEQTIDRAATTLAMDFGVKTITLVQDMKKGDYSDYIEEK